MDQTQVPPSTPENKAVLPGMFSLSVPAPMTASTISPPITVGTLDAPSTLVAGAVLDLNAPPPQLLVLTATMSTKPRATKRVVQMQGCKGASKDGASKGSVLGKRADRNQECKTAENIVQGANATENSKKHCGDDMSAKDQSKKGKNGGMEASSPGATGQLTGTSVGARQDP